MKTTSEMLTLGLQKGFAGDTNMKKIERSGFLVTSSHYEALTENGVEVVYHDEWAADQVGGGQELVRVGDQEFTRVYAGGTVSLEEMARLGITKQNVMRFLVTMIQQLGDATRLEQDCPPVADGEWQYQYVVKERLPEIRLSAGKEIISYKGEVVFVHWFLMSPVE